MVAEAVLEGGGGGELTVGGVTVGGLTAACSPKKLAHQVTKLPTEVVIPPIMLEERKE